MHQDESHKKASRPRGRPAKRKLFPPEDEQTPVYTNQEEIDLEYEAISVTGGTMGPGKHPGAFATLFSFLIQNDRSEVLRIAREVEVSDNTVYRWLNGTSEPRPSHLQRLLRVLHLPVIKNIGGTRTELPRSGGGSAGNGEAQREIFHRVLEQAAMTTDDASRRWHIIETIFEYALLHLDPERHGLALTYARLMPPQADGTIHSLCEVDTRGQAPFSFALEFNTYLGSTTLAGSAVLSQRVRTWSCKQTEMRVPVGLDKNERSSCAAPVMRGGRLAGVLIVSSVLPDFTYNPIIPGVVSDYAHMLATGLTDREFYPRDLIKLVPMPELKWQREHISRTFLNRVVDCARMDGLSFPDAERRVLQDLEKEFERLAHQLEEQEKENGTAGTLREL